MIFETEYRRTPPLKKDLGILIFWVVLITFLVLIGATKFFQSPLDMEFFSDRTAPVYSLFGTICLAYEFFTSMRNESNKNFLNQKIIKAMDDRECVQKSVVIDSDRITRVNQLNEEIEALKLDLEHEMQFVRRKFFIGQFGLGLVVLATFLQLP
ncbi:hypothetical protein [Vibrio diabolicus]|uniref:hypothetical protein n=1 Tax=Vibrio diabolicus TaxID=50719 RepID=UPI003D7E5C3D